MSLLRSLITSHLLVVRPPRRRPNWTGIEQYGVKAFDIDGDLAASSEQKSNPAARRLCFRLEPD
jgi:hypothetical protein